MAELGIMVACSFIATGVQKLDLFANGASERRKRDEEKAQATERICKEAQALLAKAEQSYLQNCAKINDTRQTLGQALQTELTKWQRQTLALETQASTALTMLTDEYQTAQKELKTLVEGLYDKNNFKLPTDKETLLKLQTFRPLHLALLRILHGDKVQATEVAHLIAEAAIDYQVRDFGIVPATILLAKSHPEDSLLKGLANLLRARMLKDAHLAIANKDATSLAAILRLDSAYLMRQATASGQTLLMAASHLGDIACVRCLLSQPVTHSLCIDKKGMSAFDYAIQSGDIKTLQALYPTSKLSLLEQAMFKDEIDVVGLLKKETTKLTSRVYHLAVALDKPTFLAHLLAKAPLSHKAFQSLMTLAKELGHADTMALLVEHASLRGVAISPSFLRLVWQSKLKILIDGDDAVGLQSFFKIYPEARALLSKICWERQTPLGYAKRNKQTQTTPLLRQALRVFLNEQHAFKTWLSDTLKSSQAQLFAARQKQALNFNNDHQTDVLHDVFYEDLNALLQSEPSHLRPERPMVHPNIGDVVRSVRHRDADALLFKHCTDEERTLLLLAEKVGLVRWDVGLASQVYNTNVPINTGAHGTYSCTHINALSVDLYLTDPKQGSSRTSIATARYQFGQGGGHINLNMITNAYGVLECSDAWRLQSFDRHTRFSPLLEELKATLSEPKYLAQAVSYCKSKTPFWVNLEKDGVDDDTLIAFHAKLASGLTKDEAKILYEGRLKKARALWQAVNDTLQKQTMRVKQLEQAIEALGLDLTTIARPAKEDGSIDELADNTQQAIFEQMLLTKSTYDIDTYCETIEDVVRLIHPPEVQPEKPVVVTAPTYKDQHRTPLPLLPSNAPLLVQALAKGFSAEEAMLWVNQQRLVPAHTGIALQWMALDHEITKGTVEGMPLAGLIAKSRKLGFLYTGSHRQGEALAMVYWGSRYTPQPIVETQSPIPVTSDLSLYQLKRASQAFQQSTLAYKNHQVFAMGMAFIAETLQDDSTSHTSISPKTLDWAAPQMVESQVVLQYVWQQAQRACGGVRQDLMTLVKTLQANGQWSDFVKSLTRKCAGLEASFYVRGGVLAFVSLLANNDKLTEIAQSDTGKQAVKQAYHDLSGILLDDSQAVTQKRLSKAKAQLTEKYIALKKSLIEEKAEKLAEIAHIKVEFKNNYDENLENLQAQEVALAEQYQLIMTKIDQQKQLAIEQSHRAIDKRYRNKMYGLNLNVQISVNGDGMRWSQVGAGTGEDRVSIDLDAVRKRFNKTSSALDKQNSMSFSSHHSELGVDILSSPIGEGQRTDDKNRSSDAPLDTQNTSVDRVNNRLLNTLLSTPSDVSAWDRMQTMGASKTWGVEESTQLAKGVAGGVVINHTLHHLNKLKYVGPLLRRVGQLGLVVGAGEFMHRAREFESNHFLSTDEYMDLTRNPLISKEKLNETFNEARRIEMLATQKLATGKDIKTRVMEHPELLGLSVGSLFGVTAPGKGLLFSNPLGGKGKSRSSAHRNFIINPKKSMLYQFNKQLDSTIQAPELVAIHRGWQELSRRQIGILEQLPKISSRITMHKNNINVMDLAALTAKTGDEFAMFTLGSRRMIIRGSNTDVPIGTKDFTKLKSEGWKWSAHTHPGDTLNHLQPSGMTGDRGVLTYLDQEQSLILNSLGRRKIFNKTGDMDLDIGNSMRVVRYEIN